MNKLHIPNKYFYNPKKSRYEMSNASMIMEFLEYMTDKRITYKKLRDKRLTCEGKP